MTSFRFTVQGYGDIVVPIPPKKHRKNKRNWAYVISDTANKVASLLIESTVNDFNIAIDSALDLKFDAPSVRSESKTRLLLDCEEKEKHSYRYLHADSTPTSPVEAFLQTIYKSELTWVCGVCGHSVVRNKSEFYQKMMLNEAGT